MAIATLSLCYNNHNVFTGALRVQCPPDIRLGLLGCSGCAACCLHGAACAALACLTLQLHMGS